jgi:hypothetical protein
MDIIIITIVIIKAMNTIKNKLQKFLIFSRKQQANCSHNCEAFKFQNTKIVFRHHMLPTPSTLYSLLNTM